MAILKHYSVHNSNYHDAVLYLTYQHDNHARTVYDEHGLMIERENLLIDGINTDIYSYAYDCAYISRKYGKNRSASDIKSHHWIISFDPKDVAGAIVSVLMCGHDAVESTKMLCRKLHAELVRFLHG